MEGLAVAVIRRAVVLAVALTVFCGGCSELPPKKVDPDAAKKEGEKMRKALQKEWGDAP